MSLSITSRSILTLFICGLILRGALPTDAAAQAYPVRQIRILVGFAAGGASDVTARLLSPKLSESLGQPVIVENRAGSGGLLATDAVAKSAPDGYTLLLIFASITAALPLLETRRVRALAVTTGKRTPLAPAMPTLHESGVPGYDRSGWYGVLAPAGVSREIISRLNSVLVKIVNTPEMKDAFIRQGLDPATSTPEEFGAFIRNEVAQNIRLVKDAGIRVE